MWTLLPGSGEDIITQSSEPAITRGAKHAITQSSEHAVPRRPAEGQLRARPPGASGGSWGASGSLMVQTEAQSDGCSFPWESLCPPPARCLACSS